MEVAVYICGVTAAEYRWYRVDFPAAGPADNKCFELPSKIIYPVATLSKSDYGYAGSWTVIGDKIYWLGGYEYFRRRVQLCKEVLVHDINNSPCPSSWKTISSSSRIPRKSRFLAAVGTNKLCLVGGHDYRGHPRADDNRWSYCGEIYNLEDDTWSYIEADHNLFKDYDSLKHVAVVENYDDEAQIMFYSTTEGCTLLLDVCSGKVEGPVQRANINLWKDCGNDLRSLLSVTADTRPVFTDNTFYWLNHRLHLIGYHVIDETWLISPSLEEQLPSVIGRPCIWPIVVALQKGRFLAVLPSASGQLTIASLTVIRLGSFLSVSVDFFQHLNLHDDLFTILDGKSVLKQDKQRTFNQPLRRMSFDRHNDPELEALLSSSKHLSLTERARILRDYREMKELERQAAKALEESQAATASKEEIVGQSSTAEEKKLLLCKYVQDETAFADKGDKKVDWGLRWIVPAAARRLI